MTRYKIIGLMSGTSLDGVDLSLVEFNVDPQGKWTFQAITCHTYDFTTELKEHLTNATALNVPDFIQLDKTLGKFFGNRINLFIKEKEIDRTQVDAIASHGQTIFHQPERGFTVQIGCGTEIAIATGIPTINDFRSKDVSCGGQGAPLVPIGDQLLFSGLADAFLNIGGFCNISFPNESSVLAFDICPGNLPLNKYCAQFFKKDYDFDGNFARKGTIHAELLEKLNALPFYSENAPKSLGTEWLDAHFYPVIDSFEIEHHDLLATLTEHIAIQIAKISNEKTAKSILITGGGAKNLFLIERIKAHSKQPIILPKNDIIDFKESIIFGFLGALYLAGQNNTINSVTGASRSVRGGVLHTP